MATNYIKVRPNVAQRLGLYNDRVILNDGNVLLYEKDLRLINRAYLFGQVDETVASVGGLLLDPYEAKRETQRAASDCLPLPEATDPAWRPVEASPAAAPEDKPADAPEENPEAEETQEAGAESGADPDEEEPEAEAEQADDDEEDSGEDEEGGES